MAVLVYPHTILQNITQRQQWQYWSIHNTLYCRTSHRDSSIGLSTIHCSRTSHRDRNGSITISLSTTHHLFTRPIATEHHTKRQQWQDQSIYTHNIKLQKNIMQRWQWQNQSIHTTITLEKNITQKYNNSSISVHNTSCGRSSPHKETATAVLLSVYPHCRRTSHKETAMAVSLSVHPQYIALQKNITQRDGNGCITIRLLYQSIHRTLSAKYNAYSYKLFQKF